MRALSPLWLAAFAVFITSVLSPSPAYAQSPVGWIAARVTAEGAPLAGVQMASGAVGALTSADGRATIRLPAGRATLTFERIGYRTVTSVVPVTADDTVSIDVELVEEAIEAEEIVVITSTRSDRRIEDEPIRVEVIGREEVEEKLLMTPGDISMLLNETSGVRVQTTSPSLGGAGVRIQGLRGRYTLILSDGLPLYGGQSGALGPLQIPPMDLAQVEVIKGAASALYGANALGGVVNLVSRRPERDRELLLNQTTLGGTDAVLWLADELSETWGYTVLGGLHRQGRADPDDDGWADLAGFRRALLRPRVFWSDGAGRSLFATVGGMIEEREGGTTETGRTPAGTSHAEELSTERFESGLVGRALLGGDLLLSVRGSGSLQNHVHLFGTAREEDRHATAFGEAAVSGAWGSHAWVLGASHQNDSYRSQEFAAFDYTHTVSSLFAQDEFAPVSAIVLSASARVDHEPDLGTFVNPRLSALLRPEPWTVRASAGSGRLAPTPLIEEVEAVGLSRIVAPAVPLKIERARSASLDVGRTFGSVEANVSAFGSIVEDAVVARPTAGGRLSLENAADPIRTWGAEALARYAREPLHVTLTYAHTRATEVFEGTRREVPLTPRHTAGLVAAWEQEGQGRVGVELYYTGTQQLDDNPYRSRSRSYVVFGFLIERRFGPARFFLNAENMLDARHTRWDPLVLPARSPDGRWTTDAWAPLEGRVINGGVRLSF